MVWQYGKVDTFECTYQSQDVTLYKVVGQVTAFFFVHFFTACGIEVLNILPPLLPTMPSNCLFFIVYYFQYTT